MAKVLLHSLTFAPDSVSTAYLLTDLAQALKGFGHSIIVLTTTPHYNIDISALNRQQMQKLWMGLVYKSNLEGIIIWHIKLPMKGKRVFSRILDYAFFHIMSLIVGFTLVGRYDIVIAPSPPLTIGVVGWLLALRRMVPFIYNIQELYPDFAISQGLVKNRFLINFSRFLERFIYKRSIKLVVISEQFSVIVKSRGVPENKVCVITNFVDVDQYPVLPKVNPFSLKNDLLESFVVYYGGNIGLSQDWDSFLHAAVTLHYLPIKFIVTGDGVRRVWLEDEIRRKKIINVNIFGYQEKQIIPLIYASSDVCTIPMKPMTTVDTFPSKVFSIMASGKSVIVQAEIGTELWSLINEANCGWVVTPGDPQSYSETILKSYSCKKELAEIGERGRRFVMAKYSKKLIVQKYNNLIKELTE